MTLASMIYPVRCARPGSAGRSASAASARSWARPSAVSCSRPASTRSTSISSAWCRRSSARSRVALLRWRATPRRRIRQRATSRAAHVAISDEHGVALRKDLGFKRIATEEAFDTKEIVHAYRDLLARKGSNDIGFNSLVGYYLHNPSERTRLVAERLEDLGDAALGDMDATGIDMQILSLTSPGVQIFDADRPSASRAPRTTSSRRRSPSIRRATRAWPRSRRRIPPPRPRRSSAPCTKLGLKGAIVNSHTHGEYLDDEKFWDIFAAAEALDVPLYIHPNTPPNARIEPFMERGLDGAVFGFAVETGLHALRTRRQRRVRPVPEAENRARASRRRAALLAVPHRLHARRERALEPLREPAEARAQGERLSEGELLLHDERHGVGAADPIRAGSHGHRSRDVRDGLPVSVRAGGSESRPTSCRSHARITKRSIRRTPSACSSSRESAGFGRHAARRKIRRAAFRECF